MKIIFSTKGLNLEGCSGILFSSAYTQVDQGTNLSPAKDRHPQCREVKKKKNNRRATPPAVKAWAFMPIK